MQLQVGRAVTDSDRSGCESLGWSDDADNDRHYVPPVEEGNVHDDDAVGEEPEHGRTEPHHQDSGSNCEDDSAATNFSPDDEQEVQGLADNQEEPNEALPGDDVAGDDVWNNDLADLEEAQRRARHVSWKTAWFLSSQKGQHEVSDLASKAFYEFFLEHAEDIVEAKRENKMPCFATLQRRSRKALPPTFIDYTYTFIDGEGQEVTKRSQSSLPRSQILNPDRLKRVCAHNYLWDLFRFYAPLHSSPPAALTHQNLQISSDGVEKAKAGRRSLHIVSLTFECCNTAIPWRVFEYVLGGSYMPSLEEYLRPVVQQLALSGANLDLVAADGKEQLALRGMITTSGFYGCARCQVSITNQRAAEGIQI